MKAARLAEVLWRRHSADVVELASTAPSSSAATGVTYKRKLGKDIVEDYKTVKIGQSAYFTGAAPSEICIVAVGDSLAADTLVVFPFLLTVTQCLLF